jgi:hypothetical protein
VLCVTLFPQRTTAADLNGGCHLCNGISSRSPFRYSCSRVECLYVLLPSIERAAPSFYLGVSACLQGFPTIAYVLVLPVEPNKPQSRNPQSAMICNSLVFPSANGSECLGISACLAAGILSCHSTDSPFPLSATDNPCCACPQVSRFLVVAYSATCGRAEIRVQLANHSDRSNLYSHHPEEP